MLHLQMFKVSTVHIETGKNNGVRSGDRSRHKTGSPYPKAAVRMCLIQPIMSRGVDVRLTLAVALSTIQVTVRFGSPPPNFVLEHPKDVQMPPPLPLPSVAREDLRLGGYLK
ncbi:hypothetical protein TNCV_4778111 [Trichonephila clavipes]|nr:hypothetical protein TNCV_4778111 [Trichonephila clavipes]